MTLTARSSSNSESTSSLLRWLSESWPDPEDERAENRFAFELAKKHARNQRNMLIVGDVPTDARGAIAGQFVGLDSEGTLRLVVVSKLRNLSPSLLPTLEDLASYKEATQAWCADRALNDRPLLVDTAVIMPIGDDNARILWRAGRL